MSKFNKILETLTSFYEIHRKTKKSKIPLILIIPAISSIFPGIRTIISEQLIKKIFGVEPSERQSLIVAFIMIFLGILVYFLDLSWKHKKASKANMSNAKSFERMERLIEKKFKLERKMFIKLHEPNEIQIKSVNPLYILFEYVIENLSKFPIKLVHWSLVINRYHIEKVIDGSNSQEIIEEIETPAKKFTKPTGQTVYRKIVWA